MKYILQGPGQQPRFDLPPEETADLEELEEFSKMFKQKRIKLGTDTQKYIKGLKYVGLIVF